MEPVPAQPVQQDHDHVRDVRLHAREHVADRPRDVRETVPLVVRDHERDGWCYPAGTSFSGGTVPTDGVVEG